MLSAHRARSVLAAAAALSLGGVALAGGAEAATPAAKKPPPPVATTGPKPADIAGRYAVLRDKTHDTGCMVTLDDRAHGPNETLKARLAPACRDQGIVIFDPVGWQMKGAELVLMARKGHSTELSTQEDGTWMNDPKKGKTLSLKKI